MKGKLTTNLSLTANTSIPKVVHEGGASTWNEITGKPFSRVDTENGLAIYDNTLMIDTLDKIATIDYVDEQIADIDLSDYATKSELDAVEAEIPSLTGYATEQYVDTAISSIPDPTWNDIRNKPTFATVATSGDYDDLSNKPTIPSIDGLATETYVNNAIAAIDIPEDVSELNNDAGYVTSTEAQQTIAALPDMTTIGWDSNNKLSVIGGGSSTQSDWEQNDSGASDYVKNRTHYLTRTSVDESWNNDGNPLTDGTYPEEEWDNYHLVEWRIDDSNTRQDILDFLDAVPTDADFSVSVSYNYTYEWEGSTESNSDSRTFTFHKESEGEYGFSGDEDDTYIEISDEDYDGYYKIRIELWNIQEEHDGDPRLDTELTSVEFSCNTTIVSYTKLDSNYINIDNNTIKVNGGGQLYTDSMNAKMGINISNKDISVKSDLNAFGPVDMGNSANENKLNTLNTPLGTYVGGGIIKTASTDDAENIKFTTWPSLSFDSSSTRREKWRCTNFITDRNLRRVHAITKYYKWYDNKWFGPYYISGMFIGQYNNDTQQYDIKIEGWESILDSIVRNGSGYDFTFKEDITISPTESTVPFPFIFIQNRDNIPDPQKINSYFLPIDNDTIKVDSDGNIYADVQGGGSTQADWTETDSTADSYIQNKPAMRAGKRTDSLIFNSVGNNQATALGATAFGYQNKSRGSQSFVVGAWNDTDSPYCVVEGIYNTQVGAYGHAQGQYKYNWPWRNAALLETDVADSIGNGTSNSNRSCAEATTWTGDKFLSGDIYTHVTNWADPRANSIKLANIPAPPTTDGNYTLAVTVTNGEPTYSWV